MVAGAAGVAVAAAGAGIQAQAAEPSDVAASDDFQITADGYYATARVEVADDLPLPLPLPKTDARNPATVRHREADGGIRPPSPQPGGEQRVADVWSPSHGTIGSR